MFLAVVTFVPEPLPSPIQTPLVEEATFGADSATRVISNTYISDTTWEAPTGVTSVTVECIGAGGAGTTNTGSGGGGAYGRAVTTVTPGNTYTIDVGAGGTVPGSDGADSIFSLAGTTKVSCDGGQGITAGGAGGTVANSSASSEFAGGSGIAGVGARGGGGGGGTTGAGANSSGASGANGGADIFGGGGYSTAGGAGGQFGSGGASGTSTQAAGADGMIRLTYTISDSTTFPKVVHRKGSVSSTANATTHTVVAPSSSLTLPGDIYIVIFAHGSNTDSNITTGAGWIEIASSSNGTTISTFAYGKIATASQEPNIVITSATTQQSQAVWYVIRDAQIDSAGAANGSSTNANPPNLNFSGGSANYVVIAAAGYDNNSSGFGITAPPATYDSFYNAGARAGNGIAIQIAAAEKQVTSTSEDPGTFTNPSEQWSAITVALKYEATPGGEIPVDPIIWFE